MSRSPEPELNLELMNSGVMTRSLEGTIESWNHGAEELYGWKKDEAIGKVSHDLLHTQFPKPLPEIESELVRNGRWQGKLVHTARDGRRLVVDSRWTFEFTGQAGKLIEINRPSAKLEAGIEIETGEITKPQSVLRSRFSQLDNMLGKISDVVLGGAAFSCIVIASYAFTRPFNYPIGKLLYGFVPIGMAAILLACLRLKPSYRINLALVCVSIAVSVYGMELFLQSSLDVNRENVVMLDLHRSKDRKEEADRLSKKFRVPIDPRNAAEALADLNKNGLDAIPFISPSNNLFVEQDGYRKSVINVGGAEVIPLAGISSRVTLLCNENGQWITYRSDAHGFNNPDMDIWKAGNVDIAAVGDSFTQGYCVPPDKSFIGLIRQTYPKTLNLGIAGDGPLMELAAIKEYLEKITPKIVLWFYCEDNDLVELQGERRTAFLPHYLKSDFKQNLVERQSAIDDAITNDLVRQEAIAKANELRRSQWRKVFDFTDFLKLSMLRAKLNLPRAMDRTEIAKLQDMEGPNLKMFEEVLAQAKSHINGFNGKMVFVYLPSWARYAKISDSRADNMLLLEMKQRERVLSIVNSLQIPIVDISQLFDAHNDPLSLFPFREPGHYNEIGHRLVAEEVLKQLSFNKPAAEPNP